MSEAACAEEEEGLKRLIARSVTLLDTIRRVESGEITVDRAAIDQSRDHVWKALRAVDKADECITGNITGCKGCPT